MAYGLTPFSSNAEVEQTLMARGIKLQSSVGGTPYALDHHYALWVLDSITTLEQAYQFLDQLDRECSEHGGVGLGCHKAYAIRQWLLNPFWTKTPERIRQAIAANRRNCCWVHEPYSFAMKKTNREREIK